MPVQPTYPGVYVQEVPSGVHTITGVSTSVALFIGRTIWGPDNKPVLCFSYSDFERTFTSDTSQSHLAYAVRLFFLNGGTQCYIIRICDTTIVNSFIVASPNSIRITAKYPGIRGDSIRVLVTENVQRPGERFDLKIYRLVPNAAGVDEEVEVETWTNISKIGSEPRHFQKIVKSNLVTIEAVGTGLDFPPFDPDSPLVLAAGHESGRPASSDYKNLYNNVIGREVDLFNLLILPRDKDYTDDASVRLLWQDASVFCQSRRAFLLVDPPDDWDTKDDVIAPGSTDGGVNTLRQTIVKDYSAVFYPNLIISENDLRIAVGPSGAIAGLMSRIDVSRGVWKAPAGVEAGIRGINGVEFLFNDLENGAFNQRAVNTIRVFPNGIVNWGARTLDGDNDFGSEWKYIPVRRTALFIEESLYRGLKWVVFEPNDERLWGQIRLNVGAFMHDLFTHGAFQGTKKSEAYFVKCDSETTTQNDINLGIVNVWVGFAPLKPAEFVILYLQQMTGQIQV